MSLVGSCASLVSVRRPAAAYNAADHGRSTCDFKREHAPVGAEPGSTTLTVAPNGGFTGSVTLACSPDPAARETACSFSNGSLSGPTLQVNLNGSSATVTFNVTTTGPHAYAARFFLSSSSGLLVAGFLLLAHRRRRQIFLGVITLALTLTFAACGGGGGGGGGGGNTDPGTSAKTYTFTVTGTSGSGASAVSVSSPVTVTVQ